MHQETPHQEEHELYPGVGSDLMKYYSYPEGNFNPANFTSTEYDIKNLDMVNSIKFKRVK